MWDILKAVSPIAGAVLGFLGSEEQNQANAAQAQAQMDFQERMSNTSYQRAVADMRAAGLNPMLAYSQGGASSPGGAQAVMQNSSAAAASAGQSVALLDQTRAQTDKIRAETVNTEAEAEARIADLKAREKAGLSSAAHTDAMAHRQREYNREDGGAWEARREFERYALERAERRGVEFYQQGRRDFRTPELSTRLAHERALTARAVLDELDQNEARAHSGYWGDVGKQGAYADRGVKYLGSLAHSAGSVGFRATRPFNELLIPREGGGFSRSGRR